MPETMSPRIPANRNELIRHAENDYASALVRVNSALLRQFDWPTEGGIQIALPAQATQSPADSLAFLLGMTALNYRFWNRDPLTGVLTRYEFGKKTGARALWKAYEAAWTQGTRSFSGPITAAAMGTWFGPFLATRDRIQILASLFEFQGERLLQVCGMLAKRIEQEGCVTVEQAATLAHHFPTAYAEPYLKKAQLALAMYAGYLAGTGICVSDRDLTAMADYQVPRVLRALEILEYSPELAQTVDAGALIAADSAEERAIRSATILACEEIAQHANTSAAAVDNALWQAQDVAKNALFHLTQTTWY